jgi:hypothetical protein
MENEKIEITEKQQKQDFAAIANFRDKNEKASWLRKKKNLEELVHVLEPIETKLLELNSQKLRLIDEMQEIRKTMMIDCVHPQDYLVHYRTFVKCRFCESNISIPRK